MARINKITRDGGRVEELAKSIVSAIEKSPVFMGKSINGTENNKSDNVLLDVKDKMSEMLDVSKKISETLNKSLENILKKVNTGIKVETTENTARETEEKKNDAEKQAKTFKDIFKNGLKNLKEGIVESMTGENKSLGALIGGLSGALGGYMVDTSKDVQRRNKAISAQAAQDAKDSETAKNEGISQNQASVVNALGGVNSKQGRAALQATDDGVVGAYSDSDISGSNGDDMARAALEDIDRKKKEEQKKSEEKRKSEESKVRSKEITKKKPIKPKTEKAVPAPENTTKIQQKSGMKVGTVKETDEGVKYQFAGKDKNGKDIWKLPEEERKGLLEDHKKRMKTSIEESSGVNMDEWLSAAKDGTFDDKFDKLSESDKEKVTKASVAYKEGMGSYANVLNKHKNKGVTFTSSELKDVKKPEQAKFVDDGSGFATHKYYGDQKTQNKGISKKGISGMREIQKQRENLDPSIKTKKDKTSALTKYGYDNLDKDIKNAKNEDVELQKLYSEQQKYSDKMMDGKLSEEDERRMDEISDKIKTRENKIKLITEDAAVAKISGVNLSPVSTGSTLNANAMRLESRKSSGNTIAVNAPTSVSNQSMTANANPPNANNMERGNSSFQGNGAIG